MDYGDWIEKYGLAVLVIVGSAQTLIQALRASGAGLTAWAEKSEDKWDDHAVSTFVKSLNVASQVCHILSMILSPLALRKPPKAPSNVDD